ADAVALGGRYLRLVGRGVADFGAEGRAATTIEALYDPRNGEWLRLDYTLGAAPLEADADADIAYATACAGTACTRAGRLAACPDAADPPRNPPRPTCCPTRGPPCVRSPSACGRARSTKWSGSDGCLRPGPRCAARSNPGACTR